MKIDVQRYLDLVEQANSLLFLDIEATGLKGDYNSVLCVSLKPYGGKPYTFSVKEAITMLGGQLVQESS
jgi:uncharacterized protein YprB with RNaseH-like and TPR domain